jgi:hypothetical protein
VEALSFGKPSENLYGSQELEIFVHLGRFEYEAMKVVRTNQRL